MTCATLMPIDGRSRRRLLVAAGNAAALLSLIGCEKLGLAPSTGNDGKPAFNGVDITGAEYARSLALPDIDGKLRTLADFNGKATVVFFGYTQCPDVCPTTMAELAQAKKLLGADGQKVQGVFVTIDPERDKPDLLKAYMASFDPSFVALRGSLDQTLATAKEFKAFYAKVPGTTDGSYTMDHTAGSYVFDPHGRVRLFVRYGLGVPALAADLKALLASG